MASHGLTEVVLNWSAEVLAHAKLQSGYCGFSHLAGSLVLVALTTIPPKYHKKPAVSHDFLMNMEKDHTQLFETNWINKTAFQLLVSCPSPRLRISNEGRLDLRTS